MLRGTGLHTVPAAPASTLRLRAFPPYGYGGAGGSGGSLTTENVAVLFTDMVGSTALASSLAPEAADELRRGHFSILRQAVAEAGGTEVKNLGDGLMVVFGVGVGRVVVRGGDAAGHRTRQPGP